MPRATALHHFGVTVSDIDASRDWYARTFGLVAGIGSGGAGEVIERFLEVPGADMEALFLDVADAHVELLHYTEPRREPGPPVAENDVGAGHVCFRVPDAAAAYRALVDGGADVVREPFEVPEGEMGGYKILRLHDPDGTRIELFEAPGGSASADPTLPVTPVAFDHIGLTVEDLERSVEWYSEVFGLVAGPRAEGAGEVVSELLEVPGTELRAAFLGVGPHRLELTRFDRPEGRPFSRPNDEVGACHPCFIVDDIEATTAKIVAAGGHPNAEILPAVEDLEGYRVLYFRDPDGIQCELFELPDGDR
jgi:lactoylglutathione lyase